MTRNRSVLAAAAVITVAAAALVLPGRGAPVRADTIDDAVKAFEDYLKTKPESSGIVNQIGDLAQKHHPKVAKAFMPLLRHADETVKIAVLQNIGKQNDPKVAGPLMGMFDAVEKEKRYKLLAAIAEGVGDADAKAHYDFLIKTAKKYLDINADVSSAAFRGCANNVCRETVDDLVKQVGVADYVTTADNPVKRAARNATKPVLNDLLRKITGEDINDVKIWNEWWKKNDKTWKPPVAGAEGKKDINASLVFADDAYGFELKKPNTRWSFRKPDGNNPYLTMEALDEGQRAAWVELNVMGNKNLKSKTPEAMADEQKGGIEGKFREFKTAEWDKKGMVAGEKSVEQILFGPHKDHDVVAMHNVYVLKSEVHYFLITYWKSGKAASLREDIEEIIKTFRLTKR